MVMLNIAIALEFFSLVCLIAHLLMFSSNGRGIAAFDYLGSVTRYLSEFVMIAMFLLIANGWTLKYKDFPMPEIYVPVSAFLIVLQLAISAL